MRTSTRRKLDAGLLGAGIAVTGVVGLVGGLAARREEVVLLSAVATLQGEGEGGAQVDEQIVYDFGSATGKHGIYRDVPGLDPSADVAVTSPDAPDELVVLSAGGDLTRLRIGDPGRTVSGRHTYRIGYPLAGLAPGGRLAWDAVGAQWEVGIGAAEIQVVAPWRFVDVRCVRGATGSTDPCDVDEVEPGRLHARVEDLDAGEGVTLYADRGPALDRAPEPVAAPPPPDDGGSGALPVGATAAIAALAGAVPTSVLVRRRGRERVRGVDAADAAWAAPGQERLVDADRLGELATTEFAPPRELSAAQGGIVLVEAVRDDHKVAWLVEQAIAGAVTIETEGDKAVRLHRTAAGDPEVAPLLDGLFDGRTTVDLGSFDPAFGEGWKQLGDHLEAWRAGSGFWDRAGDRRRTLAHAAGAVLLLAGLAAVVAGAVLAVRSGPLWLGLVGLGGVGAGAGLAALLRAWELRVRTPEGSATWLRVESFRRFLAASEAWHAEQAAARGVLRQYTAWAVAVGEIDRWSAAVARASIADAAAVSYALWAPSFGRAVSSTSDAPSSSGGGGGGGVGGGGGGGGGGSW